VEAYLLDQGAKSISSSQIATKVLDLLRDMDRLIYDRLAANYMNESGVLHTSREVTPPEGQLGLFIGQPKGGGKLRNKS